tara:strand:+ start:1840 stop:2469 length:630 start_codon:yes stop_codon:yes gene_type:complete
MALPNSGPLALSSIQGEFGGSNPIGLSEYYRGGPLVASIPNTSPIPSSGAIAISNFYGTSSVIPNDRAIRYTFGVSQSGGKFPTVTRSPNISPGAFANAAMVSNNVPATVADHRSTQAFLTFGSTFNFSSTIPAAFFSGLSLMTVQDENGSQAIPNPGTPYQPISNTVPWSVNTPSSSLPSTGVAQFNRQTSANFPGAAPGGPVNLNLS